MGDKAARAGLQRGQQGAGGILCFLCQSPGHLKTECTVPKHKLFCAHCKKHGEHNTNKFCKSFKKDQKDETARGGGRVKKNSLNGGKREFARSSKSPPKEEADEEESESDSDAGTLAGLSG